MLYDTVYNFFASILGSHASDTLGALWCEYGTYILLTLGIILVGKFVYGLFRMICPRW